MVVRRWCACVAFGLMCLVSSLDARAQDEKEIEAARHKGIEYLKSKQQKDGYWEMDKHEVGITALCTLALIENGVPHSDPVVRKGYEYVVRNSTSNTNTYDIALSVALLSRFGDRRDRPRIKSLAARLVGGQLKTGGWHYTCPLADVDVLKNPKSLVQKEGIGDNSCTQFAVLGLWVASRTGVNIDYTLSQVADRFKGAQKDDGGWDYNHAEKGGSSPSMTSAGLFCLSVAEASKIRKAKGDAGGDSSSSANPPVKSLLDDTVFSKGLKRTGEFAGGIGPGAPLYFMWSIERIGVLLGLEKIGDTDWFQKGSYALLATQQKDGSWKEGEKDTLFPTAFAILFLRKANLGSDISRLLEGEPEKKFHIPHRDKEARFDTIEEALADAKEGETIRVEGNGPFVLKNLAIDKKVSIEAGFGYTPVFTFQIGGDRLGIKLKPEKEPLARSAININKGDATIEGLHLQFDPPAIKAKIPWSAIAVRGGSLRLLNCTISEGNRQGSAGILMAAPGKLVVRNSVFIGGRAAIDVDVQGKQEVLFQNNVVYSGAGIQLSAETAPKEKPNVTLTLVQSSLQTPDAFVISDTAKGATVAVISDRCAYKGNWIGSTFLQKADSTAGRSFKGAHNIYDIKDWVGVAGKKSEKIKDAKSWSAFWGKTDSQSFKRNAPFAVSRQAGNYNHQIPARDFQAELPETAESELHLNPPGIDGFVTGPGPGYDQFRDTPDYRPWSQGKVEAGTELAAAEKKQ